MNIELSGLEMSDFGTGEVDPLLLFHEGLGSLGMWRDFPNALVSATGRRVIAWSRKVYGTSVARPETYADDFMHREADAAAEVMQGIGITQANIFGHNDGASIALLLAAWHPHRIKSLTLEAPHLFVEAICLAASNRIYGEAQDGDFLHRLGKYHQNAERIFRRWCAIWLKPSFADWNIVSELGCIKCPTLLIQGENDEYGSFPQLDRIVAQCPQARQLNLADRGYGPHVDRRTDVISATAKFLKDKSYG